MDTYFLYNDFETSGLNPADLTVFEGAWTVLDVDLRQLTPLRSRLMTVPTGPSPAFVPDPRGWNLAGIAPVVQDMHRRSGLRKDLMDAQERSILRTVEDFDRLVADDLLRAGWTPADRVFIAGSGVSHFDHPLLESMGSWLTGSAVLHYRTADVSSALTVLGVTPPKTTEELNQLALQAVSPERSSADIRRLLTDETTRRLTTWVDGEVNTTLNLDNIVEHRAADDVAWAIMLSRVLRGLLRSTV